ncbi:MAG TPA: transglutaminase domain-containing protein, partial [Verrucomicrobiota bacterium]|nr:transglutaminase domain-containing protein [Verrucomicrobiota bacterium]
LIGAILAAVLEGSRLVRIWLDFSDEDFRRIYTLCTLLLLGAIIYAFTESGGPDGLTRLLESANASTLARASTAGARTASSILRWLPMILFLFVAAQAYSTRAEIPLWTISLLVRRRMTQARLRGESLPSRAINVAYPYFAVCVFSASVHPTEGNGYFWGFCVLLAWALWDHRPRRFALPLWATALAIVVALGYYGQLGLGRLQGYLQNLDTQWMLRFSGQHQFDLRQTRTMFGRVGRLKASRKIVIRVHPEKGASPPSYLREATYQLFKSPVWRTDSSRDAFVRVEEHPPINSGVWILNPTVTNAARVSITCYLDGIARDTGNRAALLPLPEGASRLENLPAFGLKRNNLGTVVAEGPGLVIFDAYYGSDPDPEIAFDPEQRLTRTNMFAPDEPLPPEAPLALIDAEPSENPDLFVVSEERPVLQRIVEELGLSSSDPEGAKRAIVRFFSDFAYSTVLQDTRPRAEGETPLSRFLLDTRTGHCEFFATATVLLLRQAGIPARYAVGYLVHERSGDGYVVRLRDAHAWCLVWDQATQTWQNFDTTPASWLAEEQKRGSPFLWLQDAWSWVRLQFAKFRWGQSNLRPYLLSTLVPALVLLIWQIAFRRRRTTRHQAPSRVPPDWPGLDSEFYLVEKALARRGVIRRQNEPLAAWLERALAEPALAEMRDRLRRLLRLHYRYRFDPLGLSADERRQLREEARRCAEQSVR